MTSPSAPLETVTARQIAEEAGVDIETARRWFRSGALPGRRVGTPGGRAEWTTTRAAWDAFRAEHPSEDAWDTTAEDLASALGVAPATVRRWLATEGAPGAKTRRLGERAARWRTNREQFDAWYAAYLTGS